MHRATCYTVVMDTNGRTAGMHTSIVDARRRFEARDAKRAAREQAKLKAKPICGYNGCKSATIGHGMIGYTCAAGHVTR